MHTQLWAISAPCVVHSFVQVQAVADAHGAVLTQLRKRVTQLQTPNGTGWAVHRVFGFVAMRGSWGRNVCNKTTLQLLHRDCTAGGAKRWLFKDKARS